MGRNLLNYPGIRPVLALEAALSLAQGGAIILQANWLAEAISALFAGEPLHGQYRAADLFLLAFLARHGFASLQQKIAHRFAETAGTDARRRLLDRLFDLGPRYAKTAGTGNLVTLALEGVSQFRTYLELFIPRLTATAAIPAALLAYVALKDWISAIVLAVTMPILIVFLILLGLAARRRMDEQWQTYRVLSNHFVDSLRGLETLKFLGASRSHSDTIGRVSDQYRSATIRTLRVAFLSSFALDFFTMLSVASVAVSLGMRLVSGSLELGTALAVLMVAPEYFLPVRMMGADYHATLKGKEAGEAIRSIIGQPSAGAGAVECAPLPAGSEDGLCWTEDSVLALSGIEVGHDGDGPRSLTDVSLTVKGAAKIGIVGESGAGKSTLIDVLGGFLQPTAGRILVNGVEWSWSAMEDWRRQTAYIPQHPYMFSGTLADNVRFYRPDATREEVEQAVASAGLAGLVNSLPNGLDELIGSGGRPLSGGQEQRVALARAFLSRRPIILLDEPTAHLDIETEYELKETMLSLFAGKLVFLASHRLHWMPDMDRIIVLERGRVAETGTHEQLLSRKGKYCELISAQLEGIR